MNKEDAHNYLAVHYRPAIDFCLERIARKLRKFRIGRVSQEDANFIAREIAEITTMAFEAGAKFAREET